MRNRNKYAASIRNNPYNAPTPVLKSIDAVISHIAKRRAFVAPKLEVRGQHDVFHGGIVRGYSVRHFESYHPMFYWDKQTDQWFGVKQCEDHPLVPCTPPDKSIKFVESFDLYLIITKGVMGLMEAKLDGTYPFFLSVMDVSDKYDVRHWWFVGNRNQKRYRTSPMTRAEMRALDFYEWIGTPPMPAWNNRKDWAAKYLDQINNGVHWKTAMYGYLYGRYSTLDVLITDGHTILYTIK